MSTLSYSAIISERTMNGREPFTAQGVKSKFAVRNLSFWYGTKQALWDLNLLVPECSVVALIGPSGGGQSTFLRTLNCINNLINGPRHPADTMLDGLEPYVRARHLVARPH